MVARGLGCAHHQTETFGSQEGAGAGRVSGVAGSELLGWGKAPELWTRLRDSRAHRAEIRSPEREAHRAPQCISSCVVPGPWTHGPSLGVCSRGPLHGRVQRQRRPPPVGPVTPTRLPSSPPQLPLAFPCPCLWLWLVD